MKNKAVRVSDLKDAYPGARPFLWCPNCGEANSATRGDYFMASPDHVFKHCGRNMKLVTERTILEPYKAA